MPNKKRLRAPVFDDGLMFEVVEKVMAKLSDQAFSKMTEAQFKSLCAKEYQKEVTKIMMQEQRQVISSPFTNAARQLARG